jgi:hypothetical protein
VRRLDSENVLETMRAASGGRETAIQKYQRLGTKMKPMNTQSRQNATGMSMRQTANNTFTELNASVNQHRNAFFIKDQILDRDRLKAMQKNKDAQKCYIATFNTEPKLTVFKLLESDA